MDSDRLILACATTAEARAGARAGLPVVLVGLGGINGVPEQPMVSFGLAGALDGLQTGAVIDAVRIVDEGGRTIWEGPGLGVPGAVRGTILATDRVVDDPAERARLHEATGADAVDLESAILASSGRLQGVLRAVSARSARRARTPRELHLDEQTRAPGSAAIVLRRR